VKGFVDAPLEKPIEPTATLRSLSPMPPNWGPSQLSAVAAETLKIGDNPPVIDELPGNLGSVLEVWPVSGLSFNLPINQYLCEEMEIRI
jgi:hypothetical protein